MEQGHGAEPAQAEAARQPWEVLQLSEQEFHETIKQARRLMATGEPSDFLNSTVLRSMSREITAEHTATIVGWVLAGEEPEGWIKKLAEESSTSTCGHVGMNLRLCAKSSCARCYSLTSACVHTNLFDIKAAFPSCTSSRTHGFAGTGVSKRRVGISLL